MSDFETNLNTALQKAGVSATLEELTQLSVFYERILEKNKVMNLTAITEPEDFIRKHFIDSLSLLTQTDIGKQIRHGTVLKMIDVGTGCGLPGLALKIVCPQLQVVLFDSLQKRLTFLDEVIKELGLQGVSTLHGRAEDLGHDRNYRESFDLVIARAVANLSTLSEYCLPFAKTGGCFAAFKGPEPENELNQAQHAIQKLGGQLEKTSVFQIPDTDFERSITLIRKTGKTPAMYPRKAGTPAKDPL